VEWDVLPYFPRSNGSGLHVVVNASDALRTSGAPGPAASRWYAYQITGLPRTPQVRLTRPLAALCTVRVTPPHMCVVFHGLQPVYVRVSAFNGVFGSGEGGYSRPAAGANASYSAAACDAYPTHCSLTPSDQLLWSPVAPTVSLSALQV
jgi:hypothetical protein